jgi:poly(A) polymerase
MRPHEFARPTLYSANAIPAGALDPDAVRVVERLQSAGFDAFLVGGCVRDLLLGRKPKDFDVATDARPRQIRKLFRHCRIIGRRFKLAHVVFRRTDGTEHIVETATFRQAPPPQYEGEEMLITDDNTFGTAAEDALRRDFTINALFLDPRRGCIIDYVNGLPDLQARRLETIGDPNVRLREDPVRILRAVKFASRLGFRISAATFQAMLTHAVDLEKAAVPRILEEILRLLRGGHAYASFRLLAESGALGVILPPIAHFLAHEFERGAEGRAWIDLFWKDLTALDEAVHAGDPVAPAFLHAVLFYRLFERELDPARRLRRSPASSPSGVADEIVSDFGVRMRVPKLDVARAKELLSAQPKFTVRGRRHFRPASFVQHEAFPEALALFRLHCVASSQGWDAYESWYQLYRRKLGGEAVEELDGVAAPARAAEPAARLDELWGLPEKERPVKGTRSASPRAESPQASAPPAAQPPPEPAAPPEPAPAAPPPADEPPRFADPATQRLIAAMDVERQHRPSRPDAAAAAARGERSRVKIARPDSRFEFPPEPIVKVEDGPAFGDW